MNSPATTQSTDSIEISLVLPSYLEEENLRLLLPRVIKSLQTVNAAFEILVVDTPEKLDRTDSVCAEFDIRYLRRSPTSCFGDAIRTGIANARGRSVAFMDADGSHPPELLPQLLLHRGEADVVIASRYCPAGATENNVLLIFMSRVLNWTYSVILGIPCKDVSNSFRVYDAAQLRELTLRCNNFDIIQEILLKMSRRKSNFKIVEVPFTFKKRMFGKTKRNLVLFIATYIFTLIRLRFSQ